jgi:DNA-binding response OmpR family regulator
MDQDRIRLLEKRLDERGLSSDVRSAIRNARICVVDDRIDDLRGLTEALRREGFNNLVEKQSIDSISDIIDGAFDLVILDLVGVAHNLSAHDGAGVLTALKDVDPGLPILVVSGEMTTPALSTRIARADLIRSKPVMPAELASDVLLLLRERRDQYWAALAVLQELRRLRPELQERLALQERALLWYYSLRLAGDIERRRPGVVKRLAHVASIVARLGSTTLRLVRIAGSVGS